MARKRDRADQGEGAPTGWGAPIHGTPPIAGADPMGQYAAGGPAGFDPSGPAADKQPGRGRTWLILLVSFAVQLVVVLAVGNTYVVGKAADHLRDDNQLLNVVAYLPNVYAWRVTPPGNDRFHTFPAMLFALLAFFVVAALLTSALVRGPVTFWRAFVAVWLSVIVATVAAGMLRRGLLDVGDYRVVGGKLGAVLIQGGGPEVVSGALTGLLAGLVAAIVAVTSRRPAAAVVPLAAPEPVPYVEPAPPPPWHGDDVRPPALVPAAPPAGESPSLRKEQPDDAQATARFAAVPAAASATSEPASGDTTQLRRQDDGEYGPPTVVTRETSAADAERVPEPQPEPQPEPSDVEPAEAPEAAEPPVDERTTEFPAQRPQQRESTPPTQSTQSTQSTQAFPRPPDDEDLGHHPDDD